ncbi:MAG TPA: META domain-containing protein [Alphaproteobacteria bacterium]|nr:META domain-containing protein [Alphaproteobacteria bacterium]
MTGVKTAISLGMLLMLGACAGAGNKAPSGGTATLVDTRWVLTKLGDTAVAPAEREYFLLLDTKDQRASGFAGCNMFAGPYQLAGDKLTFGPLAMTRMACPPPGMTVEGAYANALRDAKGYKIAGKTMMLTDEAGKSLASFAVK